MSNKHNQQVDAPLISASTILPEFTIKSVILSLILAIVLASADAYLALKIGNTVAASIPASVIALGVLRFFRRHNVLESNMVQTAASAGEGLAAAIAYVLPGMLFLHVWQGFPYWQTVVISLFGGILGVLFSIPLRRVLLNLPSLRFPEGTAVGNVLKVSTEGGRSLKLLVQGALAGGIVGFLQTGFHVLSNSVQFWWRIGKSVFGLGFGFSPAVLAAGYIVGIEVGISLFTGVVVGWIIILPIVGFIHGVPGAKSTYEIAMGIWTNYIRFVGVGTMLVGGIWTLLGLLKPIITGLKVSFASLRKENKGSDGSIIRTERDMPLNWVIICVLMVGVLLFVFLWSYFQDIRILHIHNYLWFIILVSVFFILIVGFLTTMIAGYICGLVGSSNSPVSGILIMSILLLSFIYLLMFRITSPELAKYIASGVIVVSTMIAIIASIGGETIQDLKAGRMVGATPWKQQLMMIIGVIFASLIIGPVLELLFQAYGMGGVYPRPGMDPAQMLPAPQAGLMTTVVQGVLLHKLNWTMIIVGGVVAVFLVITDEILKRRNFRLPALAVGLGIYLPPEIIMPMVIGGVVSALVKRKGRKQGQDAAKQHQQGVLMACGMVAGSALMGVVLAIPFVIEGSSDALSVVSKEFTPIAKTLGAIVFIGLCYWFYRIGRSK